tara:strand:+ start:774 stop:1514 length:741 start_codon:yes stop_codon:yes gene_type:complete
MNEIKLKENWDTLISKIESFFSGERKEKLLKMYKHFEERMMFAPASGTAHFHNAHIGGYVEHVLHITKISQELFKLYKQLDAHIDYTEEEVVFAALHHDLGKVGDLENDYYVPNDSEWHRKNQGKYFTRGPVDNFMTVTDRAVYLLNHFGITMSENEYIAIRLTDGLYESANVDYLTGYSEDRKLKSNISILLHQADMLASRIEYENWRDSGNTDTLSKPKKPSVNKQEQQKVDNLKSKFDELFAN